MKRPAINFLALVVLAVLFTLAGCVAQDAPQRTSDRGDYRPQETTLHAQATLTPATQPAEGQAQSYTVTATINATITANSTAETTRSASVAGQQPGPVTNSPDIKPEMPINLTPGAGLGIGK